MIQHRPPAYRFGPFVLDMARRQLSGDGHVIPLRRKDLELLALLVENPDRAVSKEELLKELWPGTIVDENNLPRHISTLRRILAEHAPGDRLIETVPGWGYRFTAVVDRLDEDTVADASGGRLTRQDASARLTAPPMHFEATSPASASVRGQWALIVATALVTLLLAIAGWSVVSKRTATAQPPARTLRQFTYEPGYQASPAWSPDGSSLAFTSGQSGNLNIYIQTVRGSRISPVTTSQDHDWQPAWAPDGQRLAFRSERDSGGIYVVRANGADERRIADFGYQPRWSPDGSKILISTGLEDQGETSRLFLVSADGGAPIPFVPALLAPYRAIAANWHPDGRRISVWGLHPRTGSTFMTIDVAEGTLSVSPIAPEVSTRIDALGLTLQRFVWAPSGRFVYFEGAAETVRSLWRVSIDPVSGSWAGGPDRLTTGAGADTGIAVSPDGTQLAFAILSSKKQLWALPFDATAGRVLGGGEPVELDADDPINASLDGHGRMLVYRTMRAGRAEIRERSLEDGREEVLLAGMTTTAPHLSRDGTRLAYGRTTSVSGAASDGGVFVLPTTGGEERAIARVSGNMQWSITDWAPDRSSLIGTCTGPAPGSLRGLCLMPISAAPSTDEHLKILASDAKRNLFVPRFSPDMRWISFIASDAGRSTVYLMPAAGGPWTELTDGRFQNDKLRWGPDSRAVYFVSNRSGFLNVWRRQIDAAGQPAGPVTQVTDFNTPKRMMPASLRGMEFAVTSDKLILPLTEANSRIWLLEDVDK